MVTRVEIDERKDYLGFHTYKARDAPDPGDVYIATRPWSPDQGKTREMTKLCNHKRKLLLPSAAASPVAASCTLPVSPSTLSSGPTSSTAAPTAAAPIHADSPTSPDKTRKETYGYSFEKK
ncbi:protein split ends-like isoform X1 [Vespula maculifrons]|uniref:Protein split ends-like isoform X1 n=1 Tax=Vespula maculifrons TaxID=7453 RepID=A0ABD2BLG3_VESMC